MTDGTHQPLTIEEVRAHLLAYEERIRMLVAAWEATRPKSPFSLALDDERRNGYLDALDDVRRAIFGRTDED